LVVKKVFVIKLKKQLFQIYEKDFSLMAP